MKKLIISFVVILLSGSLIADWEPIDYPYYNLDTWSIESGISDHQETGNKDSGAISVVTGAWVGVTAGQAVIIDTIWDNSNTHIESNSLTSNQ